MRLDRYPDGLWSGAMSRVTFLGTGLIGAGLAEAALGRGAKVTVWNRSRDKLAPLVAKGAVAADTPAEAVNDAQRVHIALSDDGPVDAVLEQISGHVPEGTVVIDHTTTSPAKTAARAERWAKADLEFLHAPVFMSPQSCRDARGVILVAGPRGRFERVESALSKMTGTVWFVGERPDAAAAFKLFGNSLILTITGGVADMLIMAKHLGIEPSDAYELLQHFNPAMTLEYRGKKMAQGDFKTSFALTMARKDVGLMLEAGGDELGLLPALAERMEQLIARGHGGADVGVLAAPAFEKSDED